MMHNEQNLLELYRAIHDRVSDMIEGGILNPHNIPEDYAWLVDNLMKAAALDSKIEELMEDTAREDAENLEEEARDKLIRRTR
jgi:hypothetical protein